MDFRDLKYFEVIATEGSLARAAEKVHRTQPALTKCIDRLEEDMGTPLFEKDGRGMRLTAAGHVLLRRTRQMALMVEETQREMRDVAGGMQGEVRIGCMATLAEHMMPAVFAQLLADAPGISVHLAVAMNDTLVNWLRDGEVDLAVGPMVEGDDALHCEQIAEDTMVVMASEHHPVFASPCTLSDLLQYQWVMPATTVASRQWLEQTFERHGLPRPRVQIESNVLNTIMPVLERTSLLGFTSRFNLLAQRARVREVAVPEAQLRRRFGVVYRRRGYLPPVAERVVQLLREQGKAFYLPNS